MFKVNNEDNRMAPISVFIVNFEHVYLYFRLHVVHFGNIVSFIYLS